MDSREFINSGCNLDYKSSVIKEIVDGWATDNIDSSDISVDDTGYSFRIISSDDSTNGLYYTNLDKPINLSVDAYMLPSEKTPDNDLDYCWAISKPDDSIYYQLAQSSDKSYYSRAVYTKVGAVCPVVTLYKPSIEDKTSEKVNVPNTYLTKSIFAIIVGIIIAVLLITCLLLKYCYKNNA